MSVKWEIKKNLFKLSLSCPKGKHVIPFIYEMISKWLVPAKPLAVKKFHSTTLKNRMRLVAEVELACDETLLAERNAPFLEQEITLGVSSFYQAAKILEMRGLSLENKRVAIQEKMMALIRRFPKRFDTDLMTAMQQFLVGAEEGFKQQRSSAHLSRIIYTLYDLQRAKRDAFVKIKKEQMQTPFGEKKVNALFVALKNLKEHEVFEKRHLLKALHSFPSVQIDETSFHQVGKHLFYIECEGAIDPLKLAAEVTHRIEQRMPSVFMPRNEEEVMRTLLALSGQLKYTKDIPQVALHFEGQTAHELIFTVLMARIENKTSLCHLFNDEIFSIEKVKHVGLLRKKLVKQAVVIKAKLPRAPFVRDDYSVDVFAARIYVIQEVGKRIGEVRDYNGGIIAKQGENFARLKKLLGTVAEKQSFVLQNFFHSIYPAHYGATCDPAHLKILFLLLLSGNEGITTQRTDDGIFVVIKGEHSGAWHESIRHTPHLITTSGKGWLAMIYLETDDERQRDFIGLFAEKMKI